MIYIHGDSKQPISNTFFVNKYTTRDCYFSFQQCYFFFRSDKKSILAYWDLWDSFELKKGGWSLTPMNDQGMSDDTLETPGSN